MSDNTTYCTFIREAKNWEEFAHAEKCITETGLTLEEARAACKEFNDNREYGEIESGTKMEFESE